MPSVLIDKQLEFIFGNQYEGVMQLLDQKRNNSQKNGNDAIHSEDIWGNRSNYLVRSINEGNQEKYLGINNVITIFGDRGSGKTSLLLTIIEKLKRQNRDLEIKDLFMPVIIPEMISGSSEILGLILSYLDNVVKKVVQSGEPDWCMEPNRSTELKSVYDSIVNDYGKITGVFKKNLERKQTSTIDFITTMHDASEFEMSIRKRLNEFWDKFIYEYKRKQNDKSGNNPLIYFFFDDIDLSPEHCEEVLLTIYRYLNHPNIIVFVVACYDTLVEALTINYLKKDNLLYKDLLMQDYVGGNNYSDKESFHNALFSKNRLAKECLLKVLPTYSRFYVNKITNNRKADFSYTNNPLDDKATKSLISLLANNLLGDEALFSYSNAKEEKLNKKLTIPFSIFSDNVRGLSNIAHYLYNLGKPVFIKKDELEEHDIPKMNEKLLYILKLFINSSNVLMEYSSDLETLVGFSDKHTPFIDYNLLLDRYVQRRIHVNDSQDKQIELLNDFIVLFNLAYVVDNIILHIYGESNVNFGNQVLLSLINSPLKCEHLYSLCPQLKDIKDTLMFCQLLLDNGIEKMIISQENEDYILDKYFRLVTSFSYVYVDKYMKNIEIVESSGNYSVYCFLVDMYECDKNWSSNIINRFISGSLEYAVFNQCIQNFTNEIQDLYGFSYNKYKLDYEIYKRFYEGFDIFEYCKDRLTQYMEFLKDVKDLPEDKTLDEYIKTSVDKEDVGSVYEEIKSVFWNDIKKTFQQEVEEPEFNMSISMDLNIYIWMFNKIKKQYDYSDSLDLIDQTKFEEYLKDLEEINDINLLSLIRELKPREKEKMTREILVHKYYKILKFVKESYTENFMMKYVRAALASILRLFMPAFKDLHDSIKLEAMYMFIEKDLSEYYLISKFYIELYNKQNTKKCTDYMLESIKIQLRSFRTPSLEKKLRNNYKFKKFLRFNSHFEALYYSKFEESYTDYVQD